ncbi:DUF485 domain-containing protein [Lentzea sp. NEAU-D7]|uniref:DUF485 domain-containing protein n=1 Tax=Lentzea sp. NEAU-D7 TaxID=2994667 RepID=UPI00224B707D|nr:DUF485 domain-containing protein [Lentzea sp. NEAU-D7]MCX2952531.1 DUF485 domain-containing protein [Lentzea sp. NEAU-D7]
MTKALPSVSRPATPGFATFDEPHHSLLIDGDGEPDFDAIQTSEDFLALKRRVKRFILPATVVFLAWYVTFVLLSAYAAEFMSTPLFGTVNVGLTMGFLQIVTTVIITMAYSRYSKRKLDPQVDRVRALVETDEELA